MVKAKRKRRRAKAPAKPSQPGPDEGRRAPEENGSVQDPLEDWPDDDEDRWLRERGGVDIEKPEE
ncbi:MAG TPA: hypothetical protein VKA16_03855 [Burkholderiales bacterium]|nr:hypothetical protein [Burkholderiales bacterium]